MDIHQADKGRNKNNAKLQLSSLCIPGIVLSPFHGSSSFILTTAPVGQMFLLSSSMKIINIEQCVPPDDKTGSGW